MTKRHQKTLEKPVDVTVDDSDSLANDVLQEASDDAGRKSESDEQVAEGDEVAEHDGEGAEAGVQDSDADGQDPDSKSQDPRIENLDSQTKSLDSDADGQDPEAASQGEGSPGAMEYVAPAPISPQDPDPDGLLAIKNLEMRRKRRRRNRIIKIAIVCALVAAVVIGFFMMRQAQDSAVQGESAAQTAVVTRGDLTKSVEATGTLKPVSQVAVTPEVSGIIEEVLVTEGQHVNKGDIMFTIKNSELEKSIDDAQAAVQKANRILSDAYAGVNSAQNAYSKAKSASSKAAKSSKKQIVRAKNAARKARRNAYAAALAAIPDSATKKERTLLVVEAKQIAKDAYEKSLKESGVTLGSASFDSTSLQNAIDSARVDVSAAEEGVADAQRAYKYALEEADKRKVRAPSSGTIMALTAVSGAAVGGAKGGTSTTEGPLAYIADLSKLGVDVEVNEIDIPEVKPKQRTQVTLISIPGLTLKGKVTSVASMSSASEQESTSSGSGVVTFKVATTVKSNDDRLKPGMSATVDILTKDVRDVLMVPEGAIQDDGAGTYVLVVTNEETLETETRKVVVGERNDSSVAIESGLKEGDVVLVNSPGGNAMAQGGATK